MYTDWNDLPEDVKKQRLEGMNRARSEAPIKSGYGNAYVWSSMPTDEIIHERLSPEGEVAALIVKLTLTSQEHEIFETATEEQKKAFWDWVYWKNRMGRNNGSSKLTESKVSAIRASTLTYQELSSIYDVKKPTIYSIKNNMSWKHVTTPIVKVKHKTGVTGSRNGSAKLTEEQVRSIKRGYQDVSSKRLAEYFGVKRKAIVDIRNGRTWKQVM